MSDGERIVAAAIQHDGQVFTMPPPARHHTIVHWMAGKGYGPECMHDQGFVTTADRFVDRKIGLRIARDADQIREKVGHPELLWSEDLW